MVRIQDVRKCGVWIIHTITRHQCLCGLQANLLSDRQQNGNILRLFKSSSRTHVRLGTQFYTSFYFITYIKVLKKPYWFSEVKKLNIGKVFLIMLWQTKLAIKLPKSVCLNIALSLTSSGTAYSHVYICKHRTHYWALCRTSCFISM